MEAYKKSSSVWIKRILILLAVAGVVGCYLYFWHTGQAQQLLKSIRDLGYVGVLIGILIQTAANILPVPGEFITFVFMEIYGPVWGGLYSWIGGLAGAVGALYLTKWVAKPIFGKYAQPYLHKVDTFIGKRKALGLLLLRFVPLVPYHFVNYAAGLLNVKLWSFVWTTALGILPYTVAMSSLYAGVRQGTIKWGIAGIGIFMLLGGIGWYLRKKSGAKRM